MSKLLDYFKKKEYDAAGVKPFQGAPLLGESTAPAPDHPAKAFIELLRSDPEYRETIKANIAMTMLDAVNHYSLCPDRTEHQKAVVLNDGAERFLSLFTS